MIHFISRLRELQRNWDFIVREKQKEAMKFGVATVMAGKLRFRTMGIGR